MEEYKKVVDERLKEVVERGDVLEVLDTCERIVEEAFEKESVPRRAYALIATQKVIDRYLNQDGLSDEELKRMDEVMDRITEITKEDMMNAEKMDKESARDLLLLTIDKLKDIIRDESMPLPLKTATIKQGLELLVHASDSMCMMENDPDTDEFCDHIMSEVAKIRREIMRLQDKVNDEDHTLDNNIFGGYEKKEMRFKTILE